jgi:uncharacterized protein YdaU (DUF1376 family)
MYYYSHHIGDYRSATAHLSNEEDLAYRRLLDMYYDTERPIPLDTKWVSRRIRVGIEVVECVLQDFFVKSEDGWRSGRCDKEIVEYEAKAETARKNGKKGGRKKTTQEPAKNPVGSEQVAGGNPEETGSKANHKPKTVNHEPDTPDGVKAPASLGVPELVADGLTAETAAEWLAHRKRVKAPMTPRSWSGIKNQAVLAGIPLEDAVLMSLRNGWRGFEADWVRGRTPFARQPSTHTDFSTKNYSKGINDDGTFD